MNNSFPGKLHEWCFGMKPVLCKHFWVLVQTSGQPFGGKTWRCENCGRIHKE